MSFENKSTLNAKPPDRGVWLRAALLVTAVLAFAWLQHRYQVLDYFAGKKLGTTMAAIRAWTDGFGILGPAVFAAVAAVAMAVNFPSAMIIYISVTLFGRVAGCLLSFLIMVCGATLIHAVARKLGRPLAKKLLGRRLDAIEAKLSKRELSSVIMLRLALFMNPALNWALSLSGISYRNLILGTLIGVAPGTILLSWLTGTIVELLEAGQPLNPLKTPKLLIPLILAVVLFAGMWVLSRARHLRSATDDAEAGS